MPVIITPSDNNLDYPILPSPFVGITKEFKRTQDNRIVGAEYIFSFQGTIIPRKGNPYQDTTSSTASVSFLETSTGPAWLTTYSDPCDDPVASTATDDQLLEILLEKERLLREKLSCQGSQIKILSLDGSVIHTIVHDAPIDIQFNTDRKAVRSDYTFTIRSPIYSDNDEVWNYLINSAEETFSINERDQALVGFKANGEIDYTRRIFEVTHNVSAVGQRGLDTATTGIYNGLEAWQHASGWIHSNTQIADKYDTILNLGGIDNNDIIPGGYTKYNHRIVEDADRFGGKYSITESFVYSSGDPAIENVSFTIDRDTSPRTTVKINGTIEGLNDTSPTGVDALLDKYDNAKSFFNTVESSFRQRCEQVAGLTYLHVLPLSKSIGHNPNAGEVSYDYSYDNRPPHLIDGALSESIRISDTYPGQNFSETPVIGRNQPILQYMNSRSSYKRKLDVDIVMSGNEVWTSGNPTVSQLTNYLISQKPSITNSGEFADIYAAANPINDGAVTGQVFYGPPQENWDPITGQYSYSVEWTYSK